MNRTWSRCVCAVAVALAVGSSSPAWAGGSPKDKQEAKALVKDAGKAAKDKRWADAAKALQRADELDPDPQTKLDLARALVPMGKLVDASRALNGVTASAKGPSAKKQIDAAQKLLAEIEPRIPWLKITVQPAEAGGAKTAIDGHDIDAKDEVPVDPGEHVVTVEADGFEPVEKQLRLAEGKHEKLTIKLEPTAAPVAKKTEEDAGGGGGSVLPAVLAFGVGAAGIGVGSVFGIMAFNETSKVEQNCKGTKCPPRVQAALDTAKTNGTVSTIAFIVGGVGIAGGIVLLLTSGASAKPDDGADKTATVRPFVGPREVGVAGTF